MGDPADLNFMKLKKWLVAHGCPEEEVKGKMNKEELLKILPKYFQPSSQHTGNPSRIIGNDNS